MEGKRREKKFFVIIIVIFLVVLVCSAPLWERRVFCYDSGIAHPNVAQLAALLYNKTNPNQKLTVEDIECLIIGAEEEDTPTRWLNHFYDPVYNVGLLFGGRHQLSAKEWAIDSQSQTNFALGDQSWQRALADFKNGDRKDSLKELGHVLHLIADMSIPAHTRDDIHVLPADSYEQYVKKNWNEIRKSINSKFISVNNLGEAFDGLANYSNNNFYSDDTIESGKYKIVYISRSELFRDENGNLQKVFVARDNKLEEHKLYFIQDNQSWRDKIVEDKKDLRNDLILSDYSSHLVPKAVGYSAGVIQLFFSEAAKAQAANLPENRISLLGIGNQIVGWGINLAEDVKNYLTSKFGDNNQALGQVAGEIRSDRAASVPSVAALSAPTTVPPSPVINKSVSTPPPVKQAPASQPNNSPAAPVAVVAPVVPKLNNPSSSPSGGAGGYTYIGGGSGSGGSATSETSPISVPTVLPPSNDSPTSTPTSTLPIPDNSPTSTPTSTPISTSTDPLPDLPDDSPTSTPTSTLPIPDGAPTSTSTPTSTPPIPDNSTPTSTPSSTFSTPLVVINEIAWAGTNGSDRRYAGDEWIELYNTSSTPIDLSNWKIMVSGRELKPLKIANSVIAPHDYYLLERTDDKTVADIPADIVFSLENGLRNSGEKLSLIDPAGQIIDEVDCSTGWFAGDNILYRSMERISQNRESNDPANWQSNRGPRPKGQIDGGGDAVPLYGSPRQPNFGNIVLKNNQEEIKRVLPKVDNPYYLADYTVPVGSTLEIDAGVVIKTFWKKVGLYVEGNLEIKGTVDDLVVMTSGENIPAPQDWKGIWFKENSTGHIAGLEMSYAGAPFQPPNAGIWTPNVEEAVRLDKAAVNIVDSFFRDNGKETIYLVNSTSSIKNTQFTIGETAIESQDSALSLDNVSVSNFSSLSGPFHVVRSWPEIKNLNLENNVFNGIYLEYPNFVSGTVLDKKYPWYLNAPAVSTGAKLTVEPGAKILLPNWGGLRVEGSLEAMGTAAEPISIEPFGANEKWGYLYFKNSQSNLSHVNLVGSNHLWVNEVQVMGTNGTIIADRSQVSLRNISFSQTEPAKRIISSRQSQLDVADSIVGYENLPIIETAGIDIEEGSLKLRNVKFKNLQYGIFGVSTPLPSLDMDLFDLLNFENVQNPITPLPPWVNL